MADFIEPIERIVCAANNYNGLIILGIRHCDDFMATSLISILTDSEIKIFHEYVEIQGFLTNKGRFVTREEAWIIAENAGQIINNLPCDDARKLYSENLY